jgi:4-amino-4-deoxy-L-arabinose transferase-like glycosyltransferase
MKYSIRYIPTSRIVVALLAVHLVLAVGSMRRLSLTFDEPNYTAAGYQFIKTGDQQLIPLQLHPPLSYYLNSLLLLPLDLDSVHVSGPDFYTSQPLIFESGYSPKLLIFLTRLPFVFVSVLLGFLIWRWGQKVYGNPAGLLALFFYALSPIVLANARLATPDIVLALTTAAAFYTFHEYLRQPSTKLLCLSGAVLGLALLSKFTALLLIPTFLFVAVLYQRKRNEKTLNQLLHVFAQMAPLLGIAFVVVWAGYGFQFGVPFVPNWLQPQLDKITGKPFWQMVSFFRRHEIPIPAFSYILGIYTQLAAAKGWHNNFLFGHLSQTGWWYYYWLAFLIKNTIPFLLCLAAGLLLARKGAERNDRERLILYSVIPLVLFFSLPTKINIGVRYTLPLFPLFCIIAGRAGLVLRGKWRYALALLCVWQIGSVAWIHPYYLSYFNEFVGGPSNGYKYLVDSNLDWGQNLDRLSDYLKEHHITDAKISYFGPDGVMKYYGLKNIGPEEYNPSPGVWAISATSLQGLYLEDPDSFQWLRKLQPKEVIGYSIFIYDVDQEDLQEMSSPSQRASFMQE